MNAAPATIRTARLVLRRPVAGDAQSMFDLARCDAVSSDGSAFPWAITLDGRLLGMVEVRVDGHRAEIGYALARAAWGGGYTSEAARAASARVLEKAGMTREACLRAWARTPAFGTPRDVWCYAAVKPAKEAA